MRSLIGKDRTQEDVNFIPARVVVLFFLLQVDAKRLAGRDRPCRKSVSGNHELRNPGCSELSQAGVCQCCCGHLVLRSAEARSPQKLSRTVAGTA